MNSAAADLNSAQELLNASTKDRKLKFQVWADSSTRVAKALGSKKLIKATALFERQSRCKATREAVEVSSRRFFEATEAALPAADLQALSAAHARCVAEFQAAQREVDKAAARAAAMPEAVAAVAPYYHAEVHHRAALATADQAVEKLQHNVAEAKARYKGALRSLEALSNEAHQAQSRGPEPRGCSAAQSPAQSPIASAAVSPPMNMSHSKRGMAGEEDSKLRPSTTTGVCPQRQLYRPCVAKKRRALPCAIGVSSAAKAKSDDLAYSSGMEDSDQDAI